MLKKIGKLYKMSSLSIKKVSVEEQHEEFVNENMTFININEKMLAENEALLAENEALLAENEMLKNIIFKLSFQSAGLTSSFLKLNCMSLDWEYIQK